MPGNSKVQPVPKIQKTRTFPFGDTHRNYPGAPGSGQAKSMFGQPTSVQHSISDSSVGSGFVCAAAAVGSRLADVLRATVDGRGFGLSDPDRNDVHLLLLAVQLATQIKESLLAASLILRAKLVVIGKHPRQPGWIGAPGALVVPAGSVAAFGDAGSHDSGTNKRESTGQDAVSVTRLTDTAT